MAAVIASHRAIVASRPAIRTSCISSTGIRPAQPVARPSLRASARVYAIPVSGPGQTVPEPTGAPAGQITSALIESMKAKIGEALETDKVEIIDVYGDGRHVSIDVVSNLFDGKNSVQRQRMVYKVGVYTQHFKVNAHVDLW